MLEIERKNKFSSRCVNIKVQIHNLVINQTHHYQHSSAYKLRHGRRKKSGVLHVFLCQVLKGGNETDLLMYSVKHFTLQNFYFI